MNTRTYMIIASGLLVAALALVAFVAYVALVPSTPAPSETPDTPDPAFPSSGTAGTGGISAQTMSIPLRNGEEVMVRDFIASDTTAEDPVNPGNYYLAGSNGYCDENGTCFSGAASDMFNIVYFSADRSFVIALIDEPLREARREAEAFLQSALGLSREELCMINYYLSTDTYVNSQYAGMNLGFSFCPGATVLP